MDTQHRVALALIIALLVIFGSFVLLAATVHSEASTSSGWQHVKEIQLTNVPQDPGYVVRFLLINSTGTDDFANYTIYTPSLNFPNDIRFSLNRSGGDWLPQFIDHERLMYRSDQVFVYVKLPESQSGTLTIYLFYSNTNASLYSDGSAVFEYFEDFNTNSSLNNFTSSTSGEAKTNITIGSSELRIEGWVYKYATSGTGEGVITLTMSKYAIQNITLDTKNTVLFISKFRVTVSSTANLRLTYFANRLQNIISETTVNASHAYSHDQYSNNNKFTFKSNSTNTSDLSTQTYYFDEITFNYTNAEEKLFDYSQVYFIANRTSSLDGNDNSLIISFVFKINDKLNSADAHDFAYIDYVALTSFKCSTVIIAQIITDPSTDSSGGGSGTSTDPASPWWQDIGASIVNFFKNNMYIAGIALAVVGFLFLISRRLSTALGLIMLAVGVLLIAYYTGYLNIPWLGGG